MVGKTMATKLRFDKSLIAHHFFFTKIIAFFKIKTNLFRMKHLKVWFSLAAVLFFITACQKDEPTAPCDETNQLKLNQLQIIASHNSYRLRTYAPLYEKIWSLGPLLPPEFDPSGFDYEHLPLPQQFDDYGVRGIELDIYLDPNGGLFYNRMANLIIPEPIESGIPELLAPGIKILHVSDLDYMTNYLTFKAALQTLKTWSEAHPNHLPIFFTYRNQRNRCR